MSKGYVLQVFGPVIDVQFQSIEDVPKVKDILILDKGTGEKLSLETSIIMNNTIARCIALGPPEGIAKGMEVTNTKNPFTYL